MEGQGQGKDQDGLATLGKEESAGRQVAHGCESYELAKDENGLEDDGDLAKVYAEDWSQVEIGGQDISFNLQKGFWDKSAKAVDQQRRDE
eukprot:10766615-Karenia_brevis.AAC.1